MVIPGLTWNLARSHGQSARPEAFCLGPISLYHPRMLRSAPPSILERFKCELVDAIRSVRRVPQWFKNKRRMLLQLIIILVAIAVVGLIHKQIRGADVHEPTPQNIQVDEAFSPEDR